MAYPTDPIYRLIKDPYTNQDCNVQIMKGEYQVSIPFDPDNTDYQEYLQWKANGGVPEPAA
tara:strand:- start:940 stop:1122 length:183 start_codon:yes stop_codon:yes gene_type:complete